MEPANLTIDSAGALSGTPRDQCAVYHVTPSCARRTQCLTFDKVTRAHDMSMRVVYRYIEP
jgi:hypothetical protein